MIFKQKNMKKIEILDASQLRSELEPKFEKIYAELDFLKQVKLKEQNNKMLLNTKQACELLGVSRSSLIRYCNNGYLPKKKIGNRVVFSKSDLLNLVQNVNQQNYEKN